MPPIEPISQNRTLRQSFMRVFVLFVSMVCGAAVLIYIFIQYCVLPPSSFPVQYRITIDRGQTLFSISRELVRDNVIRSPRVFEMAMLTMGSEKNVSEGEYVFESPINVFQVALRISGRQFGIGREKVTFPEGFTVREMSMRLGATYPDFNTTLFTQIAGNSQGYLFPDTYKFFPSVTADAVVETLKNNYEKKVAPFRTEMESFGKSEKEVIIMASIVEKEAFGEGDRAVIAGILWKRIAQGMPLQVDAPFLFLLGKASKDLTRADLATVSPYNTYLNKGLPPTPINNPGIASIQAVLRPASSPYLFYLHDAKGAVHYARTYKEHKRNIALYL